MDLPDDLMREVKLRAIDQNRSIKDVVVDALRRGLDATAEGDTAVRRVRLPLVECAPESTERDELSPKAVADLLIAQEAEWHAG